MFPARYWQYCDNLITDTPNVVIDMQHSVRNKVQMNGAYLGC